MKVQRHAITRSQKKRYKLTLSKISDELKNLKVNNFVYGCKVKKDGRE